MRKSLIVLIILLLMIMPVNAAGKKQANNPDFPWVYSCGDSTGQDCPDTKDTNQDTITNNTKRLVDTFSRYSKGQNVSGYILAARPFFSGNERISRYSFSLSSSGVTETFTEISDRSKPPFRSNTTPSCQGFLSGNSIGLDPDLLQVLHPPDMIQQQRGQLRAKDTLARDYPGIAKVCMVNSVYWDGQESDRRNEYFFVDSKVVIVPYSGTDRPDTIKTREVQFSYKVSQDSSGLLPLHDLWITDPEPGTSSLESLENSQELSKSDSWCNNYRGPFGSSVTLGSDDLNQYGWRIATGFFSHYADHPVSIDPRLEIVINETDARDTLPHRLISTQFNGTRGWCIMSGWTCREYPHETSVFGSDFDLVWSGRGAGGSSIKTTTMESTAT